MRNKITVLIVALISSIGFSQELKFKVQGLEKDTTIHLVKYQSGKLFYADTAEMKKGVVKFDGAKQQAGLFALLMPDQTFFDFIYNNEEVFIEVTHPDLMNTLKVRESNENMVFFNYIAFMRQNQEEAQILTQEKESLPAGDPQIEGLQKRIASLGDNVKRYQKSLIAENPGTFVAAMVKMAMDIDIPEPPRNPDGSLVDSAFSYKYFRDHYFDNVDLKDDRLVRTSIIQKKLDYFISPKMMIQHPDTLIKYVGAVIDQIPRGSEMYKFFVVTTSSSFEKSKVMGMDKAMNVFIDRYYCSEDEEGNKGAFWMEEERLDDLCKSTKTRLRLVQGVKPPNVILPDTSSQNWYDFYSLDSDYTILYFWDPSCGHCKKSTPKLNELYEKKLKDRNVEVFAVAKATGDDFDKWRKFIKQHDLSFVNVGLTQEVYDLAQQDIHALIPAKTTLESINYQRTYDIYSSPRVWILDKDKVIIGKGLTMMAQLEDYMDKIQGVPESPKLFEIENGK